MPEIMTIPKTKFGGLLNETTPTFYGRNHPSFGPLLSLIQSDLLPLERAKAETDENFLQPIPYCTFANLFGYLSYARKGNEERLHGLRSIGIGGHIDFEDGNFKNGLLREMKEEIGYSPCWDYPYTTGFIYDPTSPVGRVHLGVVTGFVARPDELRAEKELIDAKWVNWNEICRTIQDYELWSRLVIKNILGLD